MISEWHVSTAHLQKKHMGSEIFKQKFWAEDRNVFLLFLIS